MHRYEELEKIYYKKLYLKVFFGVLVIILLIGGSIFYIKEKIKRFEKSMPNKKILNHYKKLKFILPNINSLPEPEVNKKINNKKEKSNIKKEIKNNKMVEKKPLVKKAIMQKPQIEIKESNVNLDSLIKEYEKNKNYNLAINIAKIYLKKNNLKQAQIWALRANDLDPSKPDSWIIFADILIKEHKLKKAKEILNVYITSYGNNDIIEEKLRSIDGK